MSLFPGGQLILSVVYKLLDPTIFTSQFIPERFKIVSEIRAVKKEMSHTFPLYNKKNDTICILEPWYATIN